MMDCQKVLREVLHLTCSVRFTPVLLHVSEHVGGQVIGSHGDAADTRVSWSGSHLCSSAPLLLVSSQLVFLTLILLHLHRTESTRSASLTAGRHTHTQCG